MSRTIKRGPPPKRPAARRKQPVRKLGLFERAIAALPVSEETIRKAATWTITGGGIAVALAAPLLAIVSAIAIFDLANEARSIIADTFLTFEIWLTIAAIYLFVTLVLSSLPIFRLG